MQTKSRRQKRSNGLTAMMIASALSLSGAYYLSRSYVDSTASSSNVDSEIIIESDVYDEPPSTIDKTELTENISNAIEYTNFAREAYKQHRTEIRINENIHRSVAILAKTSDMIKMYDKLMQKPINKNPSNITCISGMTASQFDELIDMIIEHRGLTDSNKLHGTGKAFAYIEEEYGINGIYILAIFTQESGFATRCANTNNFAGIKSGRGYRYFETPSDCIYYIGSLLRNKYVDRGLVSLTEIGSVYCETSTWPSNVGGIVDTYLDYMDKIV